MANLMPPPRRPRLARSRRNQGWALRRPALGIELRGHSLFLAALGPGWRHRWLTATGVIENFAQLDAAQLRDRIREVLGAAAGDEPLVVLGLPRREVMFRHLLLPAAAAKQMENVLSLQLGLYKPSDDADFCSDAAVVRDRQQLAVSLVFMPRPRLEELARTLADAGYPPSRVTTAQLATLDWTLRGAPERENVRLLLVQANAGEVEIAVVERGCCAVTRGFPLADGMGAEAVAAEIRKLLAAQRATAAEPFTVVISGEGAASWRPALAEFGEVQELAQYCDAWALTEGPEAGATDRFWGAMALALDGLNWVGQYRLNLMPRELRPVRRRWRNAPAVALLALNLILLTGLAARGPLQRYLVLRRYNAEIERIERNASLVERQLHKTQQMESRLAALRDYQERGRRPLDALSELAQKLPADAWVGTYTCRQGQVDISGTAKSASALLPALKASPEFQDVQFAGGLTRDNDGSERFHIQMKLRAGQ